MKQREKYIYIRDRVYIYILRVKLLEYRTCRVSMGRGTAKSAVANKK